MLCLSRFWTTLSSGAPDPCNQEGEQVWCPPKNLPSKRKGYIYKNVFKDTTDNVKQLWLKKVSYSLQKILPGKILTFYIVYFYRFTGLWNKPNKIFSYWSIGWPQSYNREIIYLYVFRIQLTVLRNCYLVKIY